MRRPIKVIADLPWEVHSPSKLKLCGRNFHLEYSGNRYWMLSGYDEAAEIMALHSTKTRDEGAIALADEFRKCTVIVAG